MPAIPGIDSMPFMPCISPGVGWALPGADMSMPCISCAGVSAAALPALDMSIPGMSFMPDMPDMPDMPWPAVGLADLAGAALAFTLAFGAGLAAGLAALRAAGLAAGFFFAGGIFIPGMFIPGMPCIDWAATGADRSRGIAPNSSSARVIRSAPNAGGR